MKHKEWYTPGYGTEKVGPFLIGLMEMARPQKVLEIGFGYTTPFLMEGLKNNFELHWDGNCDPEFMKTEYDPRLVVIDDQSLETDETRADNRRKLITDNATNTVDFIEGDFMNPDIMSQVKNTYSEFDMCWFDCGGPIELQFFLDNYFDIVKEYFVVHFTFFKGKENKNGETISKFLESNPHIQRLDIIEPHKYRQGSITILRRT